MAVTATFTTINPDRGTVGDFITNNEPVTFTGTWSSTGPNYKAMTFYIRPVGGGPTSWEVLGSVPGIGTGVQSGTWSFSYDFTSVGSVTGFEIGYRWLTAPTYPAPVPGPVLPQPPHNQPPSDQIFAQKVTIDPGQPCFLPGTRIATPSGEVAVETLKPGDLLLTADGRAVPVRFLGHRAVLARFAPPERANPIRIMAGALAENVPARDLFVSPNHGIVVDGVLAIASALTNGTTIAQVPPPAERFTYYSIETEGHEVILAEGCPAETFMDHVPRARWDNYQDYLALHPDEPQIAEMDLPHAKSHRQVPREIHARIAERAAALLGPVRDAA